MPSKIDAICDAAARLGGSSSTAGAVRGDARLDACLAAADRLARGDAANPELVRQRDLIQSLVSAAGAELKKFPRGPTGLPSDETRNSPEYRAAKAAYNSAFEKLRNFNGRHLKDLR